MSNLLTRNLIRFSGPTVLITSYCLQLLSLITIYGMYIHNMYTAPLSVTHSEVHYQLKIIAPAKYTGCILILTQVSSDSYQGRIDKLNFYLRVLQLVIDCTFSIEVIDNGNFVLQKVWDLKDKVIDFFP